MSGLGILGLAIGASGHVATSLFIQNRVYALGLPRLVKAAIMVFLWGGALAVPAVFVAKGQAARVAAGAWTSLPRAWQGYLSLCGVSACVGAAACRRRQVRPGRELVGESSQTIDIAERLGYKPAGQGARAVLARLPFNEIFMLQLATNEYRPPRLPAEWDGLSILHLSDLHFAGTPDRGYFEEAVALANEWRVDLAVFTGDLLDRRPLLAWLPETLGRLRAPMGCYFVLGNHDWYQGPDQIRRHLAKAGWEDVAGRTRTLEWRGRPLVLAGTELPWMGRAPDVAGTPEEAFRILLSHTPDRIRWARRHGFDLMLAGHNHAGQVRLPLVGPLYCPSWYGRRYASGTFWEEPTMLHVSRGLGATHPVRWRCPPEITRLVLRAPADSPRDATAPAAVGTRSASRSLRSHSMRRRRSRSWRYRSPIARSKARYAALRAMWRNWARQR